MHSGSESEDRGQRPVRPLDGYRVLDMATMVAAPFCAAILGEFGAEVIKVEMPGKGDMLRAFGMRSANGASFNWLSEARNKKSITLDLRTERGQAIARQLAAKSDIVTENFRPGTLARWGLGPDALKALKADLILVSVSAYGQQGPYKDRLGYARIAHGFSGLSHVTGQADGPPVVPGAFALADYVAGLYAALGAVLAIVARNRYGIGQAVDVSLYEGMFRMLDDMVPVYGKTGFVRQRMGPDCDNAVPHSNYQTKDGRWVALACSNDKMFARLAKVMDREALLERFARVDERLKHRDEINEIVADWMAGLTAEQAMVLCSQGDVPLGPINDIADLFGDPQIQFRKSIDHVDVPGEGSVAVPGVMPRLTETPGALHSAGPLLGQHNDEIYGGVLGMSEREMASLRQDGVI